MHFVMFLCQSRVGKWDKSVIFSKLFYNVWCDVLSLIQWGALQYHSFVVTVDCCIGGEWEEEEQKMSKRSVVLLPCMVSSPFVHMMSVLCNEWVQMAWHQGLWILILGHVTGAGVSQRTDHPHDDWSNSHNCSHTALWQSRIWQYGNDNYLGAYMAHALTNTCLFTC
jgi:hypothetical protein